MVRESIAKDCGEGPYNIGCERDGNGRVEGSDDEERLSLKSCVSCTTLQKRLKNYPPSTATNSRLRERTRTFMTVSVRLMRAPQRVLEQG